MCSVLSLQGGYLLERESWKGLLKGTAGSVCSSRSTESESQQGSDPGLGGDAQGTIRLTLEL